MSKISYLKEAEEIFDQMVIDRRDFHKHPELGFNEIRTSKRVAERLTQLGMEVQTGIGQTGVVGILEGKKPGPVILMRFDMDALPILEDTGLPFASENEGVMHACGHDGHMAMGLGVASIFSKFRDEIAGTLKFVFQPAEEGLGGAFAMIADGVLEDPKPDYAFAMHLWSTLPMGTVQVTGGPAMSASSIFTLTVTGKGGHGALPHQAVDPILASGHIITAMQSIVSRNIDPQESVVISLGQIQAGTTFNVIPESVTIKGTVRTFSNDVHRQLYRRILETSRSVGAAFGCSVSLETIVIVAAVVNDDEVAETVEKSARTIVGPDNIINKREMASEDMGYMLEEVPGCYFFIGASPEPDLTNTRPHHHPKFDFNEGAMINGVATMTKSVGHYVLPHLNGAS